jgi:hypothetical protein
MFCRTASLFGIVALFGVAAGAHAYDNDSVECRSRGYKYTECEVPFRHPQLVEQLSDAACVANQSWGYNRNSASIWVSNGCSAVFAEGNRGYGRERDRERDDYDNSDRRNDRDDYREERHERSRREEVVECRSTGYAFTRCGAVWRRARLIEQLSTSACVENDSWGIDDDGLWVDKGCSGRFSGH